MVSTEIIEQINDRLNYGGLIFSICSLVISIFLFLLIAIHKNLRSLTYDFLLFVFISEIVNNIGNIIEYSQKPGSALFISGSDMFTFLSFCFFTYCSFHQLIKSNKNIKNKKNLFLWISLGAALVYGGTIFAVIRTQDENDNKFYFYGDSNLNYLRFIHVGILFIMSAYICYNTFFLLKFLKEKQRSDSANSFKIAVLVKTLFRFPIICVLYWLFYIVFIFISQIDDDYKIKHLLKLFAKIFLNSRGFLIALNTIQTNKIQIIIEKIIDVQIRHNLILKLNCLGNKSKKKK